MYGTAWQEYSTLHGEDIGDGKATKVDIAWRGYLPQHGTDVQLQVVITHISTIPICSVMV
jgi:hypothetical protein